MGSRLPEALRRRKEGEALRLYARLLVEHERVRRLAAARPDARWCRPGGGAWRALHDVAFFRAGGRRSAPLRAFCARFPDAAGLPAERVPRADYLAAVAAALELAGDDIVQSGGQPPWGEGKRRDPQSAQAFEAICRRLRDRDADAAELGSLAAILDGAEPPPTPRTAPRVVFDAAEYVLRIGDTAIALPEGQERDFFRALVAESKLGRVTPVEEHGRVWKGAVDTLRRRIKAATGRPLLAHVVLSARRPVCGYRLNPNVEVRYASEASRHFVSDEELEALAARAAGRVSSRRPHDDD